MGTACPTDEQLKSLLDIGDESVVGSTLSDHLDDCNACRERLDELARESWGAIAGDEGIQLESSPDNTKGTFLKKAIAGLLDPEGKAAPEVGPQLVLVGKQFGEFEILEEIAQGGMGVVYRARQRNLNRLVALKLLGSGMLVSSDRVARFRTETEAVATIEHPNIVPIYGVGEEAGQPYFSMKLIEGGSLAQRLNELTPSAVGKSSLTGRSDFINRQQRLTDIMISICRAIHYTHERGILHRDLKPNNILMDEHGEPQITDFGLAKIMEKDSGLTDSFAVMGTPSYMAPEQATGNSRQLTTAADVYGLGAILYELLCGVPPFREETPLATMRRVIDSEPEAPRRLCAQIDPDLETICLKALSKEPEHRYATANTMAEDLERWRDGEPVLARPISWYEKSWRWGKRNPLATGLVGLIAVLLVLIVVGTASFGVRVSDLYRKSEALVTNFQLAEAEELLSQQEAMAGIAFLGTILERDPNHAGAATRLVSALTHRDLAIPKRSSMDHGAAIAEFHLSPDQKHLASLGVDGTVKLWALSEREQGVPQLEPPGVRVLLIRFDRAGDRLVGGCESGEIVIWDVASGGLLGRRQMHIGPISAMTVHPSEPIVASGGTDNILHEWSINTGESISGALPQNVLPDFIQYNRLGDEFAVGSRQGAVRIYESGTGQMVVGPFKHIGPLNGFDFDELTPRLITYGIGPKAVVWDLRDGHPVNGINIEHMAPITCARYNPDGKTIATVGEDGFARVWDANSGKQLQEFTTRKTRVEEVHFGPLGRMMLLVASGGVCQLWDAKGERMLTNALRHPARVTAAAFGHNGQSIVTGCQDGKIRVWKVGSHPHWNSIIRHEGPVNDAQFTVDGRALITAGQDGFVKVTDLVSGGQRFRPIWQRQPVGFVSLSESGRKILAGENPQRGLAVATLWDGMSGTMLAEPIRQPRGYLCGAFSPDEELMVLGSTTGVVSVWKTNNDLDPLLEYQHDGPVLSLCFDHSGTRVMSGGEDGVVVVRGVGTGNLPEGRFEHAGGIRRAVFHPNDELILTASTENRGQLWRLENGEGVAVGVALEHEDAVNWAEFSRDGSKILTASADSTVQVWNTLDQSRLGITVRHIEPVRRAHFDPSGQRVLVLGGGTAARVWDYEVGHPLTEILRHGREIEQGSFSPDGSFVMTAARDDAARIWKLPEPPLPVPIWFIRFLDCITGVAVDSTGARRSIAEERVMAIREEILALPRDGYYESIALWLLEPNEGGRMGPHTEILLQEYVDAAIDFGGFASVNEALRYAPTHPQALARQARLLSRQSVFSVASRRDADFYSSKAIELYPNRPGVWKMRADVMAAAGRIEAEWEARERFLELTEDGIVRPAGPVDAGD